MPDVVESDFDLLTARPGETVTVEHDDTGERHQATAPKPSVYEQAIVRATVDGQPRTFSEGCWSIVDRGGGHGGE